MYRARRTVPTTALVLAAVLLAGCSDTSTPAVPLPDTSDTPRASASPPSGEAFFRVYTRNVYLGGDTGPLFSLDFSQFPANLPEVTAAVSDFWDEVQATRFPERAAAIADEIAETEPHVVGLQEVASYVEVAIGPTGPVPVGGFDMLPILRNELAARGLDYDLVVRQPNTSGQLPLELGAAGVTRILGFSIGEATLVRGDVDVTGQESGHYAARLQLGPLTLLRGWSRITASFEGVPHHVVNTHLETQGLRPVHDGQADEMLARFGDLDGVTLLMGDLNSDAAAQDGDPSWTPTYDRATAAGFSDAWTRSVGPSGSGFTCCREPDLRGGALDERIDFVLVRTSKPVPGRSGRDSIGSVHATLVGADADDLTAPSGLFPSDHAGIFAAIALPSAVTAER